MHVFSVLLSAHGTVQTTAEEKYLIYDLEKSLLQTGLYAILEDEYSLAISYFCRKKLSR